MLVAVLLWGLVIGVIHFIVVGFFYQNPFVAKLYRAAEGAPGLKPWPDKKRYILTMFLGTQVEVYILTASYLYLRALFADPAAIETALILATLLAAVRVYPRFWNMWIQSSYPNHLLAVEAVNGTLGTFVIVLGLMLLPV